MKKVLLVDDNKQNIEITRDLLTAWGYQVNVAFEGMEAFDFACKHRPDVILLDVMLPGMNGFEVCKKLKNYRPTQCIPVIMLTVLNDIEDRIRGYNVGADVFLSKPIVYQELKNRVAWAINSKNAFNCMENKNQVVESLLKVMKLKDGNLYAHACKVKNYCEKVAKVLFITDEEMEYLLLGAYVHDLGKVITSVPEEHVEVGVDIISPLKMLEWIKVFVRNHHEKMNGQGFPDGLTANEMSLELKILITVNRFIELLEQLGDQEAITELSLECEKGYWSNDVLEAIKQVLKDEVFIKSINFSNSARDKR